MSVRKIHITNSKTRNAFINFKGFVPVTKTKKVDQSNNDVINKRIIKGIAETSFDALNKKYKDLEKMALAIISEDPEINIEITGKYIESSPKVYINEDLKVAYRVNKTEKVYDPKGTLIEQREVRNLQANVAEEEPLKWSGKYFPIQKSYNKFVFIRTYQLFHDSGLTYDYLFEIAKDLEDKKSFVLLGSGKKGTDPVIFQEGGHSFRVFFEGRTKGKDYMLLMHLSNLELKPLPL